MFDTPPQPQYSAQGSPTPAPLPSIPPRSSHKRWIIVGIALVVVAIVITVIAITLSRSAAQSCLDTEDYRALTGATIEGDTISPKSSFYTDYFTFETDGISYAADTDQAAHGDQLIDRLADFYQSRETTSIRFTISGSYFTPSDTARALAQQRIDTVRASLVTAGIPIRLITANTPVYSEPEDETPDENSGTTVTVLSASDCR